MGKTVDRRQLQRQNSQIGLQETTNFLLQQIVALLEQQNEAAGLEPLTIVGAEDDEKPKAKRGLFG
jgi:hypothetical protein